MKKFFFFILIFFHTFNSNAQNNVYFLDIDNLLNKSDEGSKIINKLKKIDQQNILKIENFKNEIKNEEDEIERLKNIISKEELNKKLKNLKDKIIKYQEEKDKIFNEYENLKNKEIKTFFNKITPHIENYMKINSIKLILDKKNIFIADINYDITSDLINFLNENIKND